MYCDTILVIILCAVQWVCLARDRCDVLVRNIMLYFAVPVGADLVTGFVQEYANMGWLGCLRFWLAYFGGLVVITHCKMIPWLWLFNSQNWTCVFIFHYDTKSRQYEFLISLTLMWLGYLGIQEEKPAIRVANNKDVAIFGKLEHCGVS